MKLPFCVILPYKFIKQQAAFRFQLFSINLRYRIFYSTPFVYAFYSFVKFKRIQASLIFRRSVARSLRNKNFFNDSSRAHQRSSRSPKPIIPQRKPNSRFLSRLINKLFSKLGHGLVAGIPRGRREVSER